MSESLRRRAARFLLKRILVYAGIYVAVVAVFLFLESKLVFHPHTAAEAWLQPADRRTRDVEFSSADGTKLHAWWLPPTRPEAGAFLASHGNGGNLSYRGDLALYLNNATDAGVLMYDYPGYGKSDGSPTEAGCYAACDAAYAWLTTEGKIPPRHVILLGESIGTGVAVESATRHEHRALVLMCPFTTLPAAAKSHYPWLPTHTLMRSRFDSLARIGRCTRPLLVGHSTDDHVVPFWQGEALFHASNEPKELHRTEGAGHNLASEEFARVVARFLEAHPASD
ncbi:alpha/beta hydrolase [Urbifossiella limnaea]|uniref:Alpha/beta hydrolase family protein n=1 Tax=Urbifossiella limnaea TaxID=2528023 RepID=A0A517XT48_9BACT|nr:alpha/beta hydrolase [Urbifossiella limnaea]QDU20671.1 Alpha/beta hydrolase family protein [Urbifossiella limnaea]